MKIIYWLLLIPFFTLSAQSYPPTPQDKGFPYTRTANEKAIQAIAGTIALFPDSRYAYVDGKRVRLDEQNIMECWSVVQNGKLYVPEYFAGIVAAKKIRFQPIPVGLELLSDRWVYQALFPAVSVADGIESLQREGKKYLAIADYARSIGKQVFISPRGLVLISDRKINYQPDTVTDDCVVALFDTPEKYADPDIATRYIPTLKAQGKWTLQARVSKEQLLDLEQGIETKWVVTPKSRYNLQGFNSRMLGSAVPKPGIYPRLLFSEKDLPMLREHISNNKMAQKSMVEIEVLFGKSWWDETSSDGRIFRLLQEGKLDEIRASQEIPKEGAAVYHVAKLTKDHKPGIYNSHITYVTNSLTTMALYALVTNNDELGRKVAKATVSYYRLIEPRIGEHLKTSDSEFGISFEGANHSSTHWRGMHGVVPHMDLSFSLDFAGKWMSAEERKFMQLLIAKATYGRRTGAGDGPKRNWRDHNHMTWHLTHWLALAAIEGLEGFDEEGYLSGKELVHDFLEYGIDSAGQAFESNGKSGGGIQFQLLSMIALARRGDNLFGHPHLRKLLDAQVHTTSPNGRATVSSGTWGGSPLSPQFVAEMKCFFPEDKNADFLLTHAYPEINPATFDPAAYKQSLMKKTGNMRLPGPTYPSLVMAFPYVTDWAFTPSKEAINAPTDWESKTYGMFATSSDKTTDAAWLCMQVRQNHYIGTGHHHADAGMFYFSGKGVNWITESPFPKTYNARYHNLVMIDGVAQSDMSPAKASYTGSEITPEYSSASADLTYAYSWEWCTQVNRWGEGFSATPQPYQPFIWELETLPEVLEIFRGTTKYKMRPWWATSNQSNFMPTLRAPWNPVQYATRKLTLFKGKQPYALIADDVKKDDHNRLYQWSVMPGPGVWKADYPGLPDNCIVLGYNQQAEQRKDYNFNKSLQPKAGDPLLLVCAAGMNESGIENLPLITIQVEKGGNDDDKEKNSSYTRLNINRVDKQVNFRVVLVPFRMGEKLPDFTILKTWRHE
jgi:hypothetical protein